MASYEAQEGTEGVIQRIYIAYHLDNRIPVWHVDYKTGESIILNIVDPNSLKFDCDRNAVLAAQAHLKKKIPKTSVCSIT